jgi:hypothetical protein
MGIRGVWGLTTLCLKPFMVATGAGARQAVRRSGGGTGSKSGGCPRDVAGEVAIRQRQCNTNGDLRRHDTVGKKGRRAQIDMGDARVP